MQIENEKQCHEADIIFWNIDRDNLLFSGPGLLYPSSFEVFILPGIM